MRTVESFTILVHELNAHRIELFLALCHLAQAAYYPVWRSQRHADGTMDEGSFILGIFTAPGEQIIYDVPMDRWDETAWADTLEYAPVWDGHTPDDVLRRLKDLRP